MSAPMTAAGWTGLLAGAVAHEINNFVHGLSAGRLSATDGAKHPDEQPPPLDGYLDRLRRLGAQLRTLASAGQSAAKARVDQSCADALAEVTALPGQLVRAEPIGPELLVAGTPAAVTAALALLLEHALAASPEIASVRLDVDRAASPERVVVRIAAEQAWTIAPTGEWELGAWLATPRRDLRGDAGLVLAGALAEAVGGSVRVATAEAAGLAIALDLRRWPVGRD